MSAGRAARSAHPRVGGENLLPCYEALKTYGSSPRGRGKHWGIMCCRMVAGLIPAWAGKTKHYLPSYLYYWAHPRVGGENGEATVQGGGMVGSSPRGRGKPVGGALYALCPRLIPAWAGKTYFLFDSQGVFTAHPRVGGENPPR